MAWHLLKFNGNNKEEINLNLTLACGQAFRWEFFDGEWRCGFGGFIARLKQDMNLDIRFYADNESYDNIKGFLVDYFRCNVNLSEKLKLWALSDKHFASIYKNFLGIRLLRQHPVENLFSFICSSNNNISRITKLVCALAINFGSKQYIIDNNGKSNCYPAFPSVDELRVSNLEEKLRKLGFGYRAKYIRTTVDLIQKLGGEAKLLDLRKETYEDSKKFLMTLSGVGAKVADCVLLSSLDHLEAVPIDIHMFNVMKKHYSHHFSPEMLRSNSIRPVTYENIRKICNEIWNPFSGWAQLIIFSSDLKPTRFEKSENNSKSKRKASDENNQKPEQNEKIRKI